MVSTDFIENISEYQLSSFLVDKYFRLYNSIRSRINALRFQIKIGTDLRKSFDLAPVSKDISQLSELLIRLDNNSLICNTTYYSVLKSFNTFPKNLKDHCELTLGFYIPKRSSHRNGLKVLQKQLEQELLNGFDTELTIDLLDHEKFRVDQYERFFKVLKERSLAARKSDLLNRLFLEMNLRASQNWFVVFNTLTVNNDKHEEVFGDQNSTAWTNYVRSINRAVGIRLYGSWRKALKSRAEFHSYFAVVERGSKSGRLHIHCLHFLKALPEGCSDPNSGLSIPYRREIEHLKSFWAYGESHPIAVRFNNSDAYSKLYWRWPVQSEQVEGSNYRRPINVPIECKPPAAVIFYVGKYLTKEYDKPIQEEVSKWRSKLNRNLGRLFPQMIVNQSTDKQLEIILRLTHSKMFNLKTINNLPMPLLKRLAMKELINRLTLRTPQLLYKSLIGVSPRIGLSTRIKAMIAGTWIYNPASSGDLMTLHMLNTSDFNDLCKNVSKLEYQIFGNLSFSTNVSGNSMEVRYV